MKIFGVTGWKNTGKTTLVAKLVAEITERGFSVSTIKRTHHNVDLDRPGTDSFAHRTAGAQEVMLASDQRFAIMREFDTAPELSDLLDRMAPVDLVLIEGFKKEPHPKIECHRAGCQTPLIARENRTIKLIASNVSLQTDLPQVDPDNIGEITDFVLEQVGLTQKCG